MSLIPSESETLAKAIADLAKRIKNLESQQKLDFGTAIFYFRGPLVLQSGISANIPFDGWYEGDGFFWDAADPTKVYCLASRDTSWALISGTLHYNFHATGRRAFHLASYSDIGVMRNVTTVFSIGADDTDDTCVSFSIPFRVQVPTDYIVFNVLQTSGVPLDFNYAYVSVFLIR